MSGLDRPDRVIIGSSEMIVKVRILVLYGHVIV